MTNTVRVGHTGKGTKGLDEALEGKEGGNKRLLKLIPKYKYSMSGPSLLKPNKWFVAKGILEVEASFEEPVEATVEISASNDGVEIEAKKEGEIGDWLVKHLGLEDAANEKGHAFKNELAEYIASAKVEGKLFCKHDVDKGTSPEAPPLFAIGGGIEVTFVDRDKIEVEFDAVEVELEDKELKLKAGTAKIDGGFEFKFPIDLMDLGKFDFKLKIMTGVEVEPNWDTILEEVVKRVIQDVLVEIGAASLIELGAAGALIGVMLWSAYEEIKEAQALNSLPAAVEPIHEQLVSVVLDALCKNDRPTDEFMAQLYDKAAALADKNIKEKWLQKNAGATEDQYYEKIRSEIEADRDSAIKQLNLELAAPRDQTRRGVLDDTARELAFVAFARTARRSEALLYDAWVRLFEEPPRSKQPYDPSNPWRAGHYAHDPAVFEQVVKELKAGVTPTGDLDKYLATADDGLIDVAASMGSADTGGEIGPRVDPLAKGYLTVVLDAFAKLDPPDDADNRVVFEKVGVKLREDAKQKALADPNAGLDEASFYDGVSAEVEKERNEGGGPLIRKLWPQTQELARIVLWFSYARSTDYKPGRWGVWKALFGKPPENSPNRRLYDQVDEILKYKRS
jgi:hypothetical protein